MGLYSNTGSGVLQRHIAHNHPCYVAAAYPGGSGGYYDPGQFWVGNIATPATPYGWQYADTSPSTGFNCDESHFTAALLGTNNQVLPAPIVDPYTDDMVLINTPSYGVWLLSGSLFVHVDTPAVEQSFLDSGAKTVTIDDGFFNLLWHASTSKTDVLLNTIITKLHQAPAAVIAWPTTPQGGIATIQLWYRVIDGTLIQFNDPVLGGTESGYVLKAGIANAARVEATADLENHINVTVYDAQGAQLAAVYYDGTWHGTDATNPPVWTPAAGQPSIPLAP